MDREFQIFYKKHGIPLEDNTQPSIIQPASMAQDHLSQPIVSCQGLIIAELDRLKRMYLRQQSYQQKLATITASNKDLNIRMESLKKEHMKQIEVRNQEKSDSLTQFLLLFAQINRLRSLVDLLTLQASQNEKALRVIESDYDRELQKYKLLMNEECQREIKKIGKSYSDQLEIIQTQYRRKLQEMARYQASLGQVDQNIEENRRLLEKQNSLLKLRLAEAQKNIKQIKSDLKIAEADRRSEVENLNQEISEMHSKINDLQLKLDTAKRTPLRVQESNEEPVNSQREVGKSLSNVLSELLKMKTENESLKERIVQIERGQTQSAFEPRRIIQLKDELGKKDNDLQQLKEELSKRDNDLQLQQKEIDLLKQQATELKRQKDQYQRQIEEKEDKIIELYSGKQTEN